MTAIHLFIVLGLAAGAALLAVRELRARRHRHRIEDEHRVRRRRLDRLAELVGEGENGGHFDAEIAARLRRFVDDLRAES